MEKPIIIYHRGRHGDDIGIDESTIPAIERALAEGAESIEIDIRLHGPSGALFITHDPWLDRTTNGQGKLTDHSFEQVRAFRTKHGSQLALFDEVLDVVPENCQLVLDIKSPRASFVALQKIMSRGRLNKGQFLFSSFHHEILEAIKKTCSWAPVGAIMDCVPTTEYLHRLADIGVSYIHIEKDNIYMDQEFGCNFRAATRRYKINISVWTVNTQEIFQDMITYGVDGVFTDCPNLLR